MTANPRWLWLVVSILLAACGARGGDEPAAGFDSGLERTLQAGLDAFRLGRYAQAQAQFLSALSIAYQSDDSPRIVDARYNLAATLAELDRNAEALEMVNAAIAEIESDELRVPPDVLLLKSTLLYRVQDVAAANAALTQLDEHLGVSDAVRARAQFLRGLMAADSGNRDQLALQLRSLTGQGDDPRLAADKAELAAHLDALDGHVTRALSELDHVAKLRAQAGDYLTTARVLASAARIADNAKRSNEAARFYLRAGRSAAAGKRRERALRWLQHARDIAERVNDERIVEEVEMARALIEG